MATLDRWRKYLTTPKTLKFDFLKLMGREREIASGRGEMKLVSANDFRFTMSAGRPADPDYALKEIVSLRNAPQDPKGHPRVWGTAADGVQWSCHYVAPWIYTKHGLWMFGGQIVSFLTRDESTSVAANPGTELVLSLPAGSPMALAIANAISFKGIGRKMRREHVLEVLETPLRFFLEARTNRLKITAPHSASLPAHYSETWLVQPLRIMFGELVYPRLIARNEGQGRALVWITRSPEFVHDADWAPLWERDYLNQDRSLFWRRYSQLLRLVAGGIGKDGSPLEAHAITRIYHEIVQAGRGSHWIWAMAFASGIEALVRMLVPQKQELANAEREKITALVKHINQGPGDDRLRQIAINAVHRTETVGANQALRELQSAGVITKQQLKAWERLRNYVMHGNLLSPYTSSKEYEQVQALTAMLHALTREAVARLAPDQT